MNTGYSGTPLAKKLGIKENTRVCALNAPVDYAQMVAPTPAGVEFTKKASDKTAVVHLFADERSELQRHLTSLRNTIAADAAIWVSWPKKSSKVPTDITEDVIRAVAIPMGFVDIKVCAVTDVWSGLKLVIRKELR